MCICTLGAYIYGSERENQQTTMNTQTKQYENEERENGIVIEAERRKQFVAEKSIGPCHRF